MSIAELTADGRCNFKKGEAVVMHPKTGKVKPARLARKNDLPVRRVGKKGIAVELGVTK